MTDDVPLRLVLDQNFPQPLLRALADWMPPGIEIEHLGQLDDQLRSVSDRDLLIALNQLGYNGLITNNWKMLTIPLELAAMVATKATIVAMKSMGHDPIRAAGALLLELPGLPARLRPDRANVFLLQYERRRPDDAWDYLKRIAERQGITAQELHSQVRVTSDELAAPVL